MSAASSLPSENGIMASLRECSTSVGTSNDRASSRTSMAYDVRSIRSAFARFVETRWSSASDRTSAGPASGNSSVASACRDAESFRPHPSASSPSTASASRRARGEGSRSSLPRA